MKGIPHFDFEGKSKETKTTTWLEVLKRVKATIKQMLATIKQMLWWQERTKSDRAGLWQSQ